jgi:predicted SAM-dependent methyltransferase
MKFSFRRKITSYSKVRIVISNIIRCSTLFINKEKISKSTLLNVGCGPNIFDNFISLDWGWIPKIDICWDITRKPYPLKDNSLDGIFTEHCLEHISFADCEKNLREFYRILKPGGTIRIVVPDGELYADIYHRRKNGEEIYMPYEREEGYITPMARMNGIFRNHGHQFIYDFETFSYQLKKTGFKDIKKETFAHGRDPRLLIDVVWRSDESLYVEASR